MSSTAGKEMIEADGLTKKFGTFTAVDSVTFNVREGEVFGFLGHTSRGFYQGFAQAPN